VTSALADDLAGTVIDPLGGLAVMPDDEVAVQFTVMGWLVRLVALNVAVPPAHGGMIRPLVGPAEVRADCSPVGSDGGSALAELAHDVSGLVDRS
jgi:hypothetical protein